MARKRFWFSHKTAEKLLPELVEAYHSRSGIFRDRDKIFSEMPLPKGVEWESSEHFNWWFVTVMSDHAVKSRMHYPRSRLLYELIQEEGSPNIFNPDVASRLEFHVIKSRLDRMCYGANNHPKALRENSMRLVNEYDSNPKNLFSGVTDVREAKELLMTFNQFATGIAGLYLTFLVKYGLVRFDNPEDLLVKVDHHDIRIMEAIGILNLRGRDVTDEEVNAPLAEFMKRSCKKLGINVIDLDSVVWGLGVYGCSYKDPVRCEAGCPVYSFCDREGMLGSYYKDGVLRKDRFWNGSTGRLLQRPLDVRWEIDFVPVVNARLSTPIDQRPKHPLDEQIRLF